jgi:DNA (cytosine-5)-methyltransferase 1
LKILNLYAGIGGNRKLWPDNYQVTAVELNPEIAEIYQDLYPDDTVITGDAHQYLIEHYSEYDFIWSSPPCQTHSAIRKACQKDKKYPDMKLYQEIIFLKFNFKGWWIIENVKPYYMPLIPPKFELHRHLFWSNFYVKPVNFKAINIEYLKLDDAYKFFGIDLSGYRIKHRKDQIMRNCVLPELGLHILKTMKNLPNPALNSDAKGFRSLSLPLPFCAG